MRLFILPLFALLALATPALAGQNAAPAKPAADAVAQAAPTPAPAAAAPVAAPAPANSWLEGPIPPEIGKIIDVKTLPVLQNVVQPTTEIRFIGNEFGVRSYLLTNNGQGQVVYITPDGKGMLVGTLFSGEGGAITFMQLLRLRRTGFDPTPFFNASGNTAEAPATATGAAAPAPTESPGERLLREANAASWIAFGPATGAPLVVFMDPNCDHCHRLFKQLLPYTQSGKIYLRVIPIALVDADKSPRNAYAVLSAANPAAAWTALINGEEPAPVATPDPKVTAAVAANNTLFTGWQLKLTPYSIYRAKTTGEIKVLAAVPDNFSAFLTDLGVTP